MTSFLEELREVRKQVLAQSTKEIVVPLLVRDGEDVAPQWIVRFRPPATDEKLTPVQAALMNGQGISLEAASDLLIDCCDEILRFTPTGNEPVDPDGGPLRFDGGDDRWGDDVTTARQAVSKLYSLDARPLAIGATVEQLVYWLQGIDTVITKRVEGKSESSAAS